MAPSGHSLVDGAGADGRPTGIGVEQKADDVQGGAVSGCGAPAPLGCSASSDGPRDTAASATNTVPPVRQLRRAQDQVYDPLGRVGDAVIRGDFRRAAFGKGAGDGLDPGQDRVPVQPSHDDAAGVQPLGPFDRIPWRDGRKAQDRRLFRDGAAVGNRTERIHLQVVVVVEAKGLQFLDVRIEADPEGIQPLAGTGVG